MKLIVLFLYVILAVSATSDEEQWQQFKLKHNKIYKSTVEEKLRFAIFKDNLRIIETHNVRYERGEESYFLGANKFADLTNAEFKKIYLNYKPQPKRPNRPIFEHAANASDAPDAINWKDQGVVLEVKDQGTCGSCWAFSATGALEGQNAIHNKKKVSLSEQELIDCSGRYGNEGCDGGLMDYAFEYIKANGITTEASYPYTGLASSCQGATDSGIKLMGYTDVKSTESALKDAVGTIGPISVAIYADLLQLYDGGIFDNLLCLGLILDHGVLAVGYGQETKDYWIVKNSWGAEWGEQGYFRLVRNKLNNCGIANSASYPTIA